MKGYINENLFKEEWKITKWLLLVIAFQLLFIWVIGFNNLIKYINNINTTINFASGISTKNELISNHVNQFCIYFYKDKYYILFLITLAASIICVSNIEKLLKDCKLTETYSKEEISKSKFMTVVMFLIIPASVYFITVFLMFILNIKSIGKYLGVGMLFKWLLLNILVVLMLIIITKILEFIVKKIIIKKKNV